MIETKFQVGQIVKFGYNHHNYISDLQGEIVCVYQYNPWGRLYIVKSDELHKNFPNHPTDTFLVPEEYLESLDG